MEISRDDISYSAAQEKIYELVIEYAFTEGLIGEEEHKNGLTESKLIRIIKQIPIRIIGKARLKFIRDNERVKQFMPDKVHAALMEKLD